MGETDSISRQSAIDALNDTITVTGKENAINVQDYIRRVSIRLHDLPSAHPEYSGGLYVDGYNDGYRDGMKDAQPEIIRCKDCKHFDIVSQPYDENYCWKFRFTPDENGFCSYAERRTDE